MVQQDKYLMKKRFRISNINGTVFQPTILIKNFLQSTLCVIKKCETQFLFVPLYNVWSTWDSGNNILGDVYQSTLMCWSGIGPCFDIIISGDWSVASSESSPCNTCLCYQSLGFIPSISN